MVEPLLTEAASTDNVSSHGMRVRTDGHWKRDTHLIVQSSEYVLWARAKVVYCQPFQTKHLLLAWNFWPAPATGSCVHRVSLLAEDSAPANKRRRRMREQSNRYPLQRKHSPQDCVPIWRWVIKSPELRGGGFEAKANFGSAALLLT